MTDKTEHTNDQNNSENPPAAPERSADVDRLITTFAPAHERLLNEDNSFVQRVTVWTFLLVVAGTIIFLNFATVNSQIIATGILQTTTPKSVVQAFNSGRLINLNVDIGDRVKKGHLLATVQNESSQVDFEAVKYEQMVSRALVRRLKAEISGDVPGRFSIDPHVNELEVQAFRANMELHEISRKRLEEEYSENHSLIASKRREIPTLSKQYELMQELLSVRKALYESEQDQFRRDGPQKVDYLQTATAVADIERQLVLAREEIATLQRRAIKIQTTQASYELERRQQLQQELLAATKQFEDSQKKFQKVLKKNELVDLYAPFDAIIVARTDKADGTLIEAGEAVFQLLPQDSQLQAVIDVRLTDIARVEPQSDVTLKLDSLPFTKHGVLRGKVAKISADVESQNYTGQQDLVFRSWIDIETNELVDTPANFELQPGMTLEANIKTGKRTILSYLINPIFRTVSQSFIEP
ncbi:HlyD family type I secretion periplasmic adaptor subunit [Ruegeria sp.]|uniref:HlyD family type I secretion periplasmic adaptor subunit n=1 Tax=Ruegeria sp. TaxID=1879320 RepID=UPI00231EB938|nr:HlyD family type I secretion periplasmic adaptor subunit [Ruegeria sp.]MDA7965363.1 HlyD family secretion protein [Ruegeria sp.]